MTGLTSKSQDELLFVDFPASDQAVGLAACLIVVLIVAPIAENGYFLLLAELVGGWWLVVGMKSCIRCRPLE